MGLRYINTGFSPALHLQCSIPRFCPLCSLGIFYHSCLLTYRKNLFNKPCIGSECCYRSAGICPLRLRFSQGRPRISFVSLTVRPRQEFGLDSHMDLKPQTRGPQRDVVHLGWPIAPSYMSLNAGDCGVSANEYSCTHGYQINCGDLTPYLTYASN